MVPERKTAGRRSGCGGCWGARMICAREADGGWEAGAGDVMARRKSRDVCFKGVVRLRYEKWEGVRLKIMETKIYELGVQRC